MKEIGQKIRELRKKKGLSQEELADFAKVNLRTIQRIENDETEPRGKTLNLICDVLDVNVEDILDYGKETDNSFLIYFHLSVLSFLVIPLGNIILPFILWSTKKDKIIGLKELGTNVLNFQILWSALSYLFLFTGAFFMIMKFPGAVVFLTIYFVLIPFNVVFPVYFAIKLRKKYNLNPYPKWINIIK